MLSPLQGLKGKPTQRAKDIFKNLILTLQPKNGTCEWGQGFPSAEGNLLTNRDSKLGSGLISIDKRMVTNWKSRKDNQNYTG